MKGLDLFLSCLFAVIGFIGSAVWMRNEVNHGNIDTDDKLDVALIAVVTSSTCFVVGCYWMVLLPLALVCSLFLSFVYWRDIKSYIKQRKENRDEK